MILEIIKEHLESQYDGNAKIALGSYGINHPALVIKDELGGKHSQQRSPFINVIYQSDNIIIVVRKIIVGDAGHDVPDYKEFIFDLCEPDSINKVCDLIISKLKE